MLIKLAIFMLAVLGLVFVVMPFFNRAVFDFQCVQAGCSGEICKARTIFGSGTSTSCEQKPEYGCLKGCRVRDNKCGFDPVFEEDCLKCVEECKKIPAEISRCIDACYTVVNLDNLTYGHNTGAEVIS